MKSIKKTIAVCIATVVMALCMSDAMADRLFSFDYTDGGANVGRGTFTTEDAMNEQGAYQVIGVSGSANGFAISGLSDYASSNNLLYVPPSANPGFVDFSGISFTTAGGPSFNLGGSDVPGEYVLNNSQLNPDGFVGVDGSTPVALSVQAVAAAVPEPASLALVGLGLMGVAAARRRLPA